MRVFNCLLTIAAAFLCSACSSPSKEIRLPITPIPGELFHNPELTWMGYGQEGADTMTVHIMGNVEQDGIYYLPQGSTVESALRAAGGVTRRGTTSWKFSYIQRGEDRLILSTLGDNESILGYELMHEDRLVMWHEMYPGDGGALGFVDRFL